MYMQWKSIHNIQNIYNQSYKLFFIFQPLEYDLIITWKFTYNFLREISILVDLLIKSAVIWGNRR